MKQQLENQLQALLDKREKLYRKALNDEILNDKIREVQLLIKIQKDDTNTKIKNGSSNAIKKW